MPGDYMKLVEAAARAALLETFSGFNHCIMANFYEEISATLVKSPTWTSSD
jgi:hypothetical protein